MINEKLYLEFLISNFYVVFNKTNGTIKRHAQ